MDQLYELAEPQAGYFTTAQASAASHETALAVHGISDAMPSAIHITVPRQFRGRQDGVVIHRADLPDADRTRIEAVPVTTIARTLQDVAATSEPALVEQADAQAITRGTLSRRQLRRLVRDTPSLASTVVDALAQE